MNPLIKANEFSVSRELVKHVKKQYNFATDQEALDQIAKDSAKTETWVNELYQVELRPLGKFAVHLNIRRRDGKPLKRDWRHFQAIKNQLLGEECEAVELYPAESRLVDTSNKYHLWGVRDPSFRFPCGFADRDVSDDTTDNHVPGLTQRRPPKKKGKKIC